MKLHNGVKSYLRKHSYFHAPTFSRWIHETNYLQTQGCNHRVWAGKTAKVVAKLLHWHAAAATFYSAKSRQGCGLASLIYVQSYLSVKISYEIRNASSKGILPHCELAVIMQNSNSETTKTRKKGPKLICIKLQIKHLLWT